MRIAILNGICPSLMLLCLSASLCRGGASSAQDNEVLKIRSGIIKYLERPFHLTEDDLRRICGEMEKASRDMRTATRVVIHVKRSDDRFYESANIEDILSDANCEGKEIEYIRIELRIVQPEKVRDPWESAHYAYVEFARKGKTKAKLKIAHDDRNWSLLLADALEAHMERAFDDSGTATWWILMGLVGSLWFLGLRLKPRAERYETWRPIHRFIYEPPRSFLICAIVGGILGFYSNPLQESDLYVKFLGPESGFLWGEFERQFEERETFRRSVFWVVVVSFPLSLLGGFLAGGILKRKKESNSEPEDQLAGASVRR